MKSLLFVYFNLTTKNAPCDGNIIKLKNIRNPKKDFIRDRKLLFEQVVKNVLSMTGKSIRGELMDYFSGPDFLFQNSQNYNHQSNW